MFLKFNLNIVINKKIMFRLEEDINFDNYTLLIATASVGNIFPMSVEIFITSLKMKKIANGWHPAFGPIVGANAFGHDFRYDKLTPENYKSFINGSLEMFVDKKNKVAIIQMRSAVTNSLNEIFVSDLVNFIRRIDFQKILVLASCYSYKLIQQCDCVYNGTSGLYYVAPNHVLNDNASILSLPVFTRYHPQADNSAIFKSIPGCARALYLKCEEKNLPALFIFKYCVEGDNKTDAITAAKMLNEWIQILNVKNNEPEIIIPESWDYFYGNSPPNNIF